MMVTSGRMYGRHDHSLSCVVTCEACSCFVRLAQNRSRGLWAFHMLRSPGRRELSEWPFDELASGSRVRGIYKKTQLGRACCLTNLGSLRGADPNDRPGWGLPRPPGPDWQDELFQQDTRRFSSSLIQIPGHRQRRARGGQVCRHGLGYRLPGSEALGTGLIVCIHLLRASGDETGYRLAGLIIFGTIRKQMFL